MPVLAVNKIILHIYSMKLSHLKLALTCISILFFFNVYAQDDYVITAKGDSLPCKVSNPSLFSFSDYLSYKTQEMNKPLKIKADEIDSYYIKRQRAVFQSVFLPGSNKPTFLKVIEKGKINIFEKIVTTYTNGGNSQLAPTTSSATLWYISKGSNHVNELKTNQLFFPGKSKNERKDDFIDMLKDNQDAYAYYLKEKDFSFERLKTIVHFYNTGVFDVKKN